MAAADHNGGPMNGGASAVDVARAVVEVIEGKTHGPAALATVIDRSGSAPQVVAAKLLLHDDGTLIGTVGGGAIEAQVLQACRDALRWGRPARVQAHLVRDLGMCCGGTMEVFVEYVQPQVRLLVVGAGHVAQALAPLAIAVGFRVSIVDDRDELLEHPAFSGCGTATADVDELDGALAELEHSLGRDDYVLVVTRDHARDERALAELLRRPHRYLGMIGSRRKVHTVLRRVLARERALGRPEPDLARVRAPVGFALGGRTPAEIAVSIVAELVANRHGGDGAAMNVVDTVARAWTRESEADRP